MTGDRELPVPDNSAAAVVDTAALDVDSLDEDLIGACARAIAAPMLVSELRRLAVDVFGGAAGAHVRAVLRARADELEFRVSMR